MFVLLSLIGLAVAIYCIVDMTKFSDAQWQSAGQNKVLWIVLCLIFGIIGSAIYWFAIRPKVVAAV